jgi:hypothetical protein
MDARLGRGRLGSMIFCVALVLGWARGENGATNAAAALPPGVTAAMEQDFLARYEAALKTARAAKDPSGLKDYDALYANDPALDPKVKKAFEDLAVFGAAMDSMGAHPTYAFVAPEPEGKGEDKPLTLAGKVCTDFLPAVVELKTTFAKPDPPVAGQLTPDGSSHPLCLQNGRLMLIGVKVVPGAVPPPLDNPADNYGLTPNHLKEGDTDDEQDFASLEKFLAALRQPNVEVLASGQCDYVYYAICRIKPDLLVFVDDDRPGKGNFDYSFQVTDSNHTQLESDKKQITLAEDPAGMDGNPVPILQGQVYHPAAGYAGPVRVVGKFGDDFSKLTPGFSETVDWK